MIKVVVTRTSAWCALTLCNEMDERWAEYETQTQRRWTTVVEDAAHALEAADA